MSTPPALSESRASVLRCATDLLEAEGWDSLTNARIADASGFTRQWLHSLFGGHRGVLEAVTESLVGPWRAAELEILAARLPLSPTVHKSFGLLLDSPRALGIALRRLLADDGPALARIERDVAKAWHPVWQTERKLSHAESAAVSTSYLSSALGLERVVRKKQMSAALAKKTLAATVQGALRPA